MQKCIREGDRGQFLSTLLSIYDSMKKGSSEWLLPRHKKVHDIIELCSQGISLLIAKHVLNNDHAFSDHSISIITLDEDCDETLYDPEFYEERTESELGL